MTTIAIDTYITHINSTKVINCSQLFLFTTISIANNIYNIILLKLSIISDYHYILKGMFNFKINLKIQETELLNNRSKLLDNDKNNFCDDF